MPLSAKLFYGLCALVIATYATVVCIGLFMPLQTDEVGWLFLNHRALIDNYQVITLHPQCGKDVFALPLPWVWYLPAYFNNLTYAQMDNPLWIRVGGMVQFVIWLALWLAIAVKLFAIPRSKWWVALAFLLAFLGMDALPLVFLVNRPEQILTIAIGIFTLLALFADDLHQRLSWRIAGNFLLFFTAMTMHASHPKSVILLPLELATGSIFLQKLWRHRVITFAGTMAILWIGLQSYVFNARLVDCPESSAVRQDIALSVLPLSGLWQSPLKALDNFFTSFDTALYLSPYLETTKDWIPFSLHILNVLTLLTLYGLNHLAWGMYIFLLLFSVWTACRPAKAVVASALLSRLVLWTLLIALAAFFIFLGGRRSFYLPELNIPLLFLAALFALRLTYGTRPPEGRKITIYATVLLLSAVLNHILLIDRYALFVSEPQAHETFTPGRKITLSPWHYEAKRRSILELASACHLGSDHHTRHIVLDDLTYHLFRHTDQPLHMSYSTGACCGTTKNTFDPDVYLKFLNDFGSDGVIAECANFFDQLRPYAIEHNGFCCIPKSVLEKY